MGTTMPARISGDEFVPVPATDSRKPLEPGMASNYSSCFVGETRVRMADGSLRAIETIKVGDKVLGLEGRINTVLVVERVPLGWRKLYAFNSGKPFVTEEHPFMTRRGWRSIAPESTHEEIPDLIVEPLEVGDYLRLWATRTVSRGFGRGSLTAAVSCAEELEEIALTDVQAHSAPAETPLFNLLLNGDHVYFANDYLVHNKG